jgi:hypothetical protein
MDAGGHSGLVHPLHVQLRVEEGDVVGDGAGDLAPDLGPPVKPRIVEADVVVMALAV